MQGQGRNVCGSGLCKGPGEQGINQPIQAAEGKLHLGDPGGLEAEKLESQSWLPCVLCDAEHSPCPHLGVSSGRGQSHELRPLEVLCSGPRTPGVLSEGLWAGGQAGRYFDLLRQKVNIALVSMSVAFMVAAKR